MTEGIQVNPSLTSQYALKAFGEDYTRLVTQAAELRAFAESATQHIEALESAAQTNGETVARLERFIGEQRDSIQALASEKSELETQVEALQAQLRGDTKEEQWADSVTGSREPEHQDGPNTQ